MVPVRKSANFFTHITIPKSAGIITPVRIAGSWWRDDYRKGILEVRLYPLGGSSLDAVLYRRAGARMVQTSRPGRDDVPRPVWLVASDMIGRRMQMNTGLELFYEIAGFVVILLALAIAFLGSQPKEGPRR